MSAILTINLTDTDQNLLDSQMSFDFAEKIVDFSGNDFRTVRKKLERKKLDKIIKTLDVRERVRSNLNLE